MCSVYDWDTVSDAAAVALLCAVFSIYTIVGVDGGVLLLSV